MASDSSSVPPIIQKTPSDQHHGQEANSFDNQSRQQSHFQQPFDETNYQPPPPPITNFQPYLNSTPEESTGNVEPNEGSYPYDAYIGQQNDNDAPFTAFATPEAPFGQSSRGINMKYQLFLDRITPHWKARWSFSLVALLVFMARVVFSQGWYVVCYALAIYYLNLFISFISPKIDPSLNYGDDEEGGPMLPTNASDEFKPFIRRLPEFKFWLSATQATLISLFLTLFEIFDIPVFWPILLLYFIILTACTMRQQIKHMIKWKYVPWDAGKKKYTSKEGSTNSYPATV